MHVLEEGTNAMDVNLAVLFIAGIIAASLGSLVGAGGDL